VIAVVAVFVLADSSEDDGDGEGAATTATATAEPTETATPDAEGTETPTPTPTATREPTPLLTGARVTELEYDQGDTIRFRVRSSTPDEVHVHGYNLFAEVEPGRTTRMSFRADITGIFEIELENVHKQIAELRVNPG
jgi:hypothetical protein